MKKIARAKRSEAPKNNQKITSFFTPKQSSTENSVEVESNIEDIIPNTPVIVRKGQPKTKKNNSPLDDISNGKKLERKRKLSPAATNCCGEGPFKKQTLHKENIVSEVPDQDASKKVSPIKVSSIAPKPISPDIFIKDMNCTMKLKSPDFEKKHTKTPEKSTKNISQLSPDIFERTPQKDYYNLRSSSSNSTYNLRSSPQKMYTPQNSGGRNSSAKKTPNKTPSRRKTPKKLFEQSANTSDFKVEVFENFKKTPVKVQESRIGSSADTSIRSLKAQNENEMTPISKSPTKSATPTAKIKIRLNFEEERLSNIEEKEVKSNANKGSEIAKNITERAYDFEEMFEDGWGDNFDEMDTYSLDLRTSQHCTVEKIEMSNLYQRITVRSTNSNEKAVCKLTHFWAESKIEVGCKVQITAVQNKLGEWIVDNTSGFVVFEPDILIASTTVVGALFCQRKSILKNMYGGFDPTNKSMIIGSIVHELLQKCLLKDIRNPKLILEILDTVLSTRHMTEQLYDSSLSKSEIEQDVKLYIPNIVTFMQQYRPKNAKQRSTIMNGDNWKGQINEILDIEENIWCPELGLKGKVDVSIAFNGTTMPLELKTGRASMSLEHRGQIILYIMMMNKLGYTVPSGLLLYLRDNVLRELPMNEHEKRDIIIMRNNLAYYQTRKPTFESETLEFRELPPPINHHSACGKCEYNTICCAHLKKAEFDLSGHKHINDIISPVLAHLDQSHIEYFVRWSSLLALESEVNEGKQLKEIYTKTPEEREKRGKCITNVMVTGRVLEQSNFYTTTFQSDNQANFLQSGIGETSYVVVSSEKRPAVATGLVTFLDHQTITINLDRDLTRKYSGMKFHLDSYDSNSCHMFNFTNLSLLIEATPRAAELRRLIIDRCPPTFRKTLSKEIGKKAGSILKDLNRDQQRAVIKALAANDYMLIKGMPGTGKTATIVALIEFLAEIDQTVLLISHTHSAIDNVCVRLTKNTIRLMRLGAESRIHPRLKDYSEHALTKHCKTPEELDLAYKKPNVIAVTCIGTRHPLLSKRLLDVCIIDESTQVLQCSVVRALHSCKKFILVGDPDQLPPLVKSREAIVQGMSESLFERLESSESTVVLTYNYRMNQSIIDVANRVTYKGQLIPANSDIANATIQLPKYEMVEKKYKDQQWILKSLDKRLEKSVCVLDTGPTWDKKFEADWIQNKKLEKENGDVTFSCANPLEAALVVALVNAVIEGGASSQAIGVISPYRAQIEQLSALLSHLDVKVNTVDQFQGQDKDIIIYSCTKSRNTTNSQTVSKYEILEDKRRLTVAITRAKHKLIIISDKSTVALYSPFQTLFEGIPVENIINLQEGSLGYNVDSVLESCSNMLNSLKQ